VFATVLITASSAAVVASVTARAVGAAVSEYSGPSISSPGDITVGPDSELWFTNENNTSIGRITTSGVVTNFTAGISHANDITAGPDGALWFTSSSDNSIGRITTTGTVTTYTDASIVDPVSITAGPDGALWFTNYGSSSIGRITTAGTVTSYADGSVGFSIDGITAGPDGALWFTNTYTAGNDHRGPGVPARASPPRRSQ